MTLKLIFVGTRTVDLTILTGKDTMEAPPALGQGPLRTILLAQLMVRAIDRLMAELVFQSLILTGSFRTLCVH